MNIYHNVVCIIISISTQMKTLLIITAYIYVYIYNCFAARHSMYYVLEVFVVANNVSGAHYGWRQHFYFTANLLTKCITVTSHKRQNDGRVYCLFTSVFRRTTNKTPKIHIAVFLKGHQCLPQYTNIPMSSILILFCWTRNRLLSL